ncbi:MAG: DNA internalization-related competence protein ComEC/Rec2 [Gammaproteobacteria bacterium AqS3]|nr:DNA internalization-related competence protein ComEC/Rec2 [Gammaproteobacteria bacterium AqS3]
MSPLLRAVCTALCSGALAAHLWVEIPSIGGAGWLLAAALAGIALGAASQRCTSVGVVLLAGLGGALNVWQAAGGVLEQRYHLDTSERETVISGWVDGLTVQKPDQFGGGLVTRLVLQSRDEDDLRWLVFWRNAPQIAPGQCWELRVRRSELRSRGNPGSFDLARWSARDRLAASAGVLEALRRCPDRAAPVDALRQRLGARLRDELNGGVIALSLGDGSGLSEVQWEALRITGTLHLAVISGMHIVLIALLLWWAGVLIMRLPGLRQGLLLRPRADWLSVPVLLGVLGYALLAGWDTPVQRSFLMLLVLFGDRLTAIPIPPSDRWLAAFTLVLWADPLAPLAPGFWLSFVAVAVLLLLQVRYRSRPAGRHRWAVWLGRAVHLQLTLSLVLAPVMALSIGQIPLLGPLVNLIAGALFNWLLVPLSLLAAALALVVSDLSGLQPLYAWAFDAVYGLLDALAWERTLWRLEGAIPGLFLMAAAALLPLRFWVLLPLGAALLWWSEGRPPEAPSLTVFDVGQGSSVLVRSGDYQLLYDTGTELMARRAVLPALRTLGVRRLDTLIISHGDSDHSGGRADIVEQMRPRRVYAAEGQGGALPCIEGVGGQSPGGDLRWQVIWPTETGRGNESSCVVWVRTRSGSALLTGDIGRRSEFALTRRYGAALAPIQVLLVPHHGSITSSSRTWLEHIDAHTAVVSAGYPSRFGHPHPEVCRRYRELGVEVYLTGLSGAIDLELSSSGTPGVRHWRRSERRWWRYPAEASGALASGC